MNAFDPEQFWPMVLAFAQTTTRRVGQKLLIDVGSAQPEEKGDGSLVTASDQWADAELREAIATEFPDHGVLSEEVEHIFPTTDWCWIIDPIDGTTNFSRGIPMWGISLGLLYQGTPVFGYVYIPPIDQSFYGYWYGTSGLTGPTGAFSNGKPIQVRTDDPSPNQFFSLCARSTHILKHDQPFPCKIRMMGVATYNLLLVASGVAIGAVEATPKIWDIAAVWAIVQAAGANWIPLDNNPIFPLKVGENYGQQPFPTFVVSRAELETVFRPWLMAR
ncbi:MAG: inositol monophosphatase [Merismopedia sp. SIO2A8]|nr:inositol monophosphatase [Symploca sp. SIO2B6]NET47629.1 inositol monophosphatase [Merismopedia sp. SIO2A8]